MTEILLAKNGRGSICNSILAALPEWFGIPSATASYVDHAEHSPMLIARVDGEIVGFVSLSEHFGINCEIHSMGVLPDHHRNGVGTALINAAALRAAEKNFGFLTGEDTCAGAFGQELRWDQGILFFRWLPAVRRVARIMGRASELPCSDQDTCQRVSVEHVARRERNRGIPEQTARSDIHPFS